MTEKGEWFDADDPKQLKAFDDQLWESLKAARAYYENEPGADLHLWAEIGVVKGNRLALNHTPLWKGREEHGGLDSKMWLGLVTRDKHLVAVVRLVDNDGTERFFEIEGLELIDPGGITKSDRP